MDLKCMNTDVRNYAVKGLLKSVFSKFFLAAAPFGSQAKSLHHLSNTF